MSKSSLKKRLKLKILVDGSSYFKKEHPLKTLISLASKNILEIKTKKKNS